MSMPLFIHRQMRPDRFYRNTGYPRVKKPENACVCFITDGNINYVSYTRLACQEMRKWIREDTQIFVLTNEPSRVKVPEADRVLDISGLINSFNMHGISQGRFPDIIFAKFLLPLVPALENYDRIVCYDPDVVAMGPELNDLLELDFQGHDCMACGEVLMKRQLTDLVSPLEKHGLISLSETQPLQKRLHDNDYCSGGLIVWNSRAIRARLASFKHLVRFSVENQAKCAYALPEQSWLTICFDILPISNYYDYSWPRKPDDYYPLIHYAGTLKKDLKDLCRAAGYPIVETEPQPPKGTPR